MKQDPVNIKIKKTIIDCLDLTCVIDRLVKIEGWTKKKAEEGCMQYKRFLFLKLKYGDLSAIPPSNSIDDVWHAHILHTKKYTADCDTIFNQYLHHTPGGNTHGLGSIANLYNCYKETCELYKKEFNEIIYRTKPNFLTRAANKNYLLIKRSLNNAFYELRNDKKFT